MFVRPTEKYVSALGHFIVPKGWAHLDCVFWSPENDDFNIALPFKFGGFPIPSLFSTSLTSPGLGFTRCCGRERVGVSLGKPVVPSGNTPDVWSSVEMDGTRPARFGFDMLLRPSRASRRSVTPTARAERARLCIERFSACISVGATLTRGERLSLEKDSYRRFVSIAARNEGADGPKVDRSIEPTRAGGRRMKRG